MLSYGVDNKPLVASWVFSHVSTAELGAAGCPPDRFITCTGGRCAALLLAVTPHTR